MRVIVPFDPRDPNTRLSSVLSADQRQEFADAMLSDVLDAIRAAGHEPILLSPVELQGDTPLLVDERPLTPAVNGVLETTERPVAIIMADLPLVTAESVERLCSATADVVIAPGLGGGTNALRVDNPAFRVDYHEGSYRKHCRIAREKDLSISTVDSFRFAVDVDERVDLGEVLLHGGGAATEWLREAGFEIHSSDGRCTVSVPDS